MTAVDGAVVVVVVCGLRSRHQVPALRVALVGGGAGGLLALEAGIGGGELVLVLAAEVLQLRAGGAGGLNVVFQGAGVAGDIALQGAEPVEGDGQRGHTEHDAGDLADGGEVAAQGRPRRRGALGDHRQHEQRDGDAQRVEERDEERRCSRMMVRGGHRDRRQHRSGARHEDEAEAQAQDEAAALVRVARRAQPGEGTLNDLTELGDEESHRQQTEQGDAQPEQEVLGQMEEAEQRAGKEDGEAEAHHQPGDDDVGPPLARSGRSTRHDDGNDGNDAGGEPGDQPTEEGDDQELTHGSRFLADREQAPALLLLGGLPV